MNKHELLQSVSTFAILPKQIMFSSKLNPTQKLLYAYLLSNDINFNPSLGFISKMLGISVKTVLNARKVLVKHRLIKVISTKNKAAHYEFTPPESWLL